MATKRSELYSVYKHNEGYAGQVEKMRQLKAAGIECKRAHSPYVGQSGIEVFGNERVQRRASKILFGSGGFTLIELMIVLAIVGIIASVVFQAVTGPSGGIKAGGMTLTPTGVVSEQCLSGYKFIVDGNGSARQVLDEFGKGVKCQ